MKAVKIISIILVVLVVLALTLVCAGIFFTNRYLQTPAFKEEVLKAAYARCPWVPMSVSDNFQASLFSGVELHGVTIGNPTGFTGNLLTAEAFTLVTLPLAAPVESACVEIEQLSLDKPVIHTFSKRQRTSGITNPLAGKEAPLIRRPQKSNQRPQQHQLQPRLNRRRHLLSTSFSPSSLLTQGCGVTHQ